MPAITVIMLNLPSVGLNFAKIIPAIPVIHLNIPSIELNFADYMLNIPAIGLNFPSIMSDFYLSDYTFGILELRRIKEVVS